MVKLGDRIQDTVSGATGVCIGRAEYLYGCVQVLCAPEETKDGAPRDSYWYDEDRVTVVKKAVLSKPGSAKVRKGGPVQNPPRS